MIFQNAKVLQFWKCCKPRTFDKVRGKETKPNGLLQRRRVMAKGCFKGGNIGVPQFIKAGDVVNVGVATKIIYEENLWIQGRQF